MLELWVKWKGESYYKLYTMLSDSKKIAGYYSDLIDRGHVCRVLGPAITDEVLDAD